MLENIVKNEISNTSFGRCQTPVCLRKRIFIYILRKRLRTHMPVDKVKLGIDKSGNSCSYAVAQFGALFEGSSNIPKKQF